MKRFATFGAFVLVMALVVLVGAFGAEAAISAKFVNKTDRTIYLATLSEGTTDLNTEGWYKIDPGKSWTLKSDGVPGWFDSSFGYYAYASKKGAKTVYWRGDDWQAPIHPTKKFDTFNDGETEGMTVVGFRRIKGWKRSNEDYDSTATINFTIN